MIPRACATASASATAIPTRSTSPMRKLDVESANRRMLPCMYSMTMKSIPVGSFNLVNSDDVRVIEGRCCACLLHKAAPTVLRH